MTKVPPIHALVLRLLKRFSLGGRNRAPHAAHETRVSYLGLVAVLLLGGVLRLTGLGWGIPLGEYQHAGFHPDESWAMRVLAETSPAYNDWNPEEAYREGALAPNLWMLGGFVLSEAGVLEMPSAGLPFDEDYGRFMYFARLMVVAFDMVAVLFVYLILRRLTDRPWTPVLGALLLAITPYEIIYAHFMRGHIVGNSVMVLATFAATFIRTSGPWSAFAVTGFLSGLAIAARYNLGIVLVVPFCFFVWRVWEDGKRAGLEVSRRLLKLIDPRFILLLVCVPLGVFVGGPYLFLDFATIKPFLEWQANFTDKEQFKFLALFDFSKVRVYLEWLIPYGTLPALWLLFYASSLYALFARRLWRHTVPFMLFVAVYLYLMAKGYTSSALFIRAALPALPFFCLISALALGDAWTRLGKKSRGARTVLSVVTAAILVTTLAYDWAYVRAMTRPDPRTRLGEFFSRNVSRPVVRMGLYPSGLDYFVIMPVLDHLGEPRFEKVILEDFTGRQDDVDYVVLSAFEPPDYGLAAARMKTLLENGFLLEETLTNPLRLFGIELNFKRNPHDLVYPFPTLYVLRSPSRH